MPPKRKQNARRKPRQSNQKNRRNRRPRQQRATSYLPAVITAGRMLAKVAGFGKYTSPHRFKRNSMLGMGHMPPQVTTSKIKSTMITHSEYLVDVVSSTNANSNLVLGANLFQFPIQPGLPTTFPWASTVAQNFQEYRLAGMVFEYKSTCGSAVSSTNNAMGSVLMSTQYRSSAPPFTTKQEMNNEQYSTDVVPWTNACHYIECAPHQTPIDTLYVRTGPPPANEAIELFDIGTLSLATCGQQANGVVLGELWVTYQIELLKPQLGVSGNSGDSYTIQTAHYTTHSAVSNDPFNGLTKRSGSSFSIQRTTYSLTIPANTFPSGTYMYFMFLWGGTAAAISPPAFSSTNLGSLAIFADNTVGIYANPTTGTSPIVQISGTFGIINGSIDTVITLGSTGTLPGAPCDLDVFFTQINENTN